MKFKKRTLFFSIVTIYLSLGFLATDHFAFAKKKDASLAVKMRKMESLLTELLPIVISDQKFNNKKNLKKFKSGTKMIASMAHQIDFGKIKKNSKNIDPSVQIIAELFDQEAKRAWREAKNGRYEYSRRIVQGLTTFCITCHTSSSVGPQFGNLSHEDSIKGLSKYEKANYLAATRRFDAALNLYESVLDDQKYAKNRKIEWENSVRKALAISVRVKNEPNISRIIIDRALNSKYVSLFFREDAVEWKKSIIEWQKELKRTPKTEQGMKAEMKLIFARALKSQKYPTDRSGDINYLRATAAAHQLIQKYPNSKSISEALYILGMGYEALQSMGLWYLGELYYEACIKRSPYTSVANHCYKRLEESIYSGYSGSGGVSIPSDVEKKLIELRKKLKSNI